jgi:hypothetical protein
VVQQLQDVQDFRVIQQLFATLQLHAIQQHMFSVRQLKSEQQLQAAQHCLLTVQQL